MPLTPKEEADLYVQLLQGPAEDAFYQADDGSATYVLHSEGMFRVSSRLEVELITRHQLHQILIDHN